MALSTEGVPRSQDEEQRKIKKKMDFSLTLDFAREHPVHAAAHPMHHVLRMSQLSEQNDRTAWHSCNSQGSRREQSYLPGGRVTTVHRLPNPPPVSYGGRCAARGHLCSRHPLGRRAQTLGGHGHLTKDDGRTDRIHHLPLLFHAPSSSAHPQPALVFKNEPQQKGPQIRLGRHHTGGANERPGEGKEAHTEDITLGSALFLVAAT